MWGVTRLDAAPELLFGGHEDGQIQRVHGNRDFNPFAAAGNDRQHRSPQIGNPMLCWTWAMHFSAAASSENDHGSMNLDSKTAPMPSTTPSRVAAIQGMAECLTRLWAAITLRPVLRSYQERL